MNGKGTQDVFHDTADFVGASGPGEYSSLNPLRSRLASVAFAASICGWRFRSQNLTVRPTSPVLAGSAQGTPRPRFWRRAREPAVSVEPLFFAGAFHVLTCAGLRPVSL